MYLNLTLFVSYFLFLFYSYSYGFSVPPRFLQWVLSSTFLLSNKFKFTIIIIDIRHPLLIVNNRSIQGFFHKRDVVINRSFSHRELGCQLFWASCNLLVDKAV
jgi:hypothetical protein